MNGLEERIVETYVALIKYQKRTIVPTNVPESVQSAVYIKLLTMGDIAKLPDGVPDAVVDVVTANLEKGLVK
ncbi:hypothetical protein [Anaerovorax sp. IOR16]|uniref:hypothetical protein n=1 Tax=Anaerovorax sp. IOR16 TaxID=2773458 RepID=UPI0019D124D8|nr:hypothetical protein [Anaerovorax sp. IOR16]